MDYEARAARVVERFDELEIDAIWISNLTNVRYLCGFTGSNGALLIQRDRITFFTDGRYTTRAADEVKGAEIVVYHTQAAAKEVIPKTIKDSGATKIGFEADTVTYAATDQLKEYFGGDPIPTKDVVKQLRRVKEPAELSLIREAAALADAGLAHIIERVEVGRTEKEIALDLEYFMRTNGAEDVSFDLIVAAAERSALPHSVPTDREIEKGRYLLFDLGCVIDGYCSDLTRTLVVGPADDRHREIYDLVSRANEAGLEAVTAGATGADVDTAARDVIADGGHAKEFSHGLGHGVGLDVHEEPVLRPGSEDILQTNEVVTVEPGVYIPDWGGVRIEDLVVVGESEPEIVSASDKSLVVL